MLMHCFAPLIFEIRIMTHGVIFTRLSWDHWHEDSKASSLPHLMLFDWLLI